MTSQTARKGRPFLFLAAVLVSVPAAADSVKLPSLYDWRFEKPLETRHLQNAKDLGALFDSKHYAKPAANTSLPRFYLMQLVPDLNDLRPVQAKTSLFIRAVAPLVLRTNEKIMHQRTTLEGIVATRKDGKPLADAKKRWLEALIQLYAAKADDLEDLQNRVDIIPPSLAIAQAINESAWGTARLAKKSNGMFGQHASSWLRSGTVKALGANVSVAAFPTLLDGVSAYMTNLNRNRAYAKLRALRAEQRRRKKAPDGHTLAAGLLGYSARGSTYVNSLRQLISAHKLSIYDTARLDTDGKTVLIQVRR